MAVLYTPAPIAYPPASPIRVPSYCALLSGLVIHRHHLSPIN